MAEAKAKYRVTIVTGDLPGADTRANVSIQFFGTTGQTGDLRLPQNKHSFQIGKTDTFELSARDVGELKKIRLGHDGKGFGASWYVTTVTVEKAADGQSFAEGTKVVFSVNKWFDRTQDDGQIVRDIVADAFLGKTPLTMYKVTIRTMPDPGSGTGSNVYINILGENGETGSRYLVNASKQAFSAGHTDVFHIEAEDVGRLKSIKIGHDNSAWIRKSWYLNDVTVKTEKKGEYLFICKKWFDKESGDRLIEREVFATEEEDRIKTQETTYTVTVTTGDLRGAGTSARVYITIFGEKGDSGQRWLDSSPSNFQRASVDVFTVVSTDLGDIRRIRIGHDNSGFGADWFLEKVAIKNERTSKVWNFFCGQYLSASMGDRQLERDLISNDSEVKMPFTTYKVTVRTGKVRGAGTDANVFIVIYGEVLDSGRKNLDNSSNNFERGQTDVFRFDCMDLGDLKKILIGHDGTGPGAGWYLQDVSIKNERTGWEWNFPCGRWLDKKEDDGLIERELLPSDSKASGGVTYKIEVKTGDRRGAGTDANVFIEMYGDKGKSGPHNLSAKGKNAFERNQSDNFLIETVDLGELQKIRIGHDGSGLGDSWFLDKVIIRASFDEGIDRSWYFLCGRWLATGEDDGATTRELPASNEDGVCTAPIVTYKITTVTGNVRGAGTDANVFIQLFGDKGETGEIKLEGAKNCFERGQKDTFGVTVVDLGELKKVRIGHDGSGFGSGWFLDKVIVRSGKGKEYYFLCGKWLDKGEDDGLIVRELEVSEQDGVVTIPTITYKLTVVTGDRRGAGTSANVSVTLYGEKGNSGVRKLEGAKNPFARGGTDLFGIETIDLGQLTKLRIGHDNKGFTPGWFLDKVIVENEATQEKWFFNCGKWLAKDEDDKLIERDLPATKEGQDPPALSMYKVTVITGDRRGAGTDANVYIYIFGDKGDSGQKFLDKPGNCFERAQTDEFGLELFDLGELKKIRIGHDNHGFGASWFLDKVIIKNEKDGKEWFFLCGRWLAKDEEDGAIEREIVASDKDGQSCLPMTYYKVTTLTGNRRGAGTSANVFVTLFGETGDTGAKKLEGPDCFNRGKTDEFGLECVDIGAIKRIKIEHDGSKPGAGWFLDKVIVKSEALKKEWFFLVGRWLAVDEDDGQISLELFPRDEDGQASPPLTTYRVTVLTGDRPGAGTDANVFMTAYGTQGDSGKQKLDNAQDNFERNKTDIFTFECPELGELTKIRIGHDNKGFGASWFLDKVTITNLSNNKNYYFLCGRWLSKGEDDGAIERELPASSEDGQASQPLTKYSIAVTTGNVRGAGTDANVFVILYGETSDSGKRLLDGPGNNFERGNTDTFSVETVELGKLTKIRVGHDGAGIGAGWFLEKIVIKNERTSEEYNFPCNRWFDKGVDDGKIERDLFVNGEPGPGAATYRITVITGTVRGAGTDATVRISVVGDKGKIDNEKLENAKDNFEKGKVDNFQISTLDLGEIKHITIGHDGRGIGSGWFLDKVFVTHENTGKRWTFPCNRWLDKGEDDKKIERTLFPASGDVTTYTIKVKTGKVKGAGTDANVYMWLIGDKGKTDKMELKNSLTNLNKFESGCLDVFNMDAKDIGQATSLIIGHDNSGFGASWFLECVTVLNLADQREFYFPCSKWFDKDKDDKKIERELPVQATEGSVQLVNDVMDDDEDAPSQKQPRKTAEESESKESSSKFKLPGFGKKKKDEEPAQQAETPAESIPANENTASEATGSDSPAPTKKGPSSGTLLIDVIAGRNLASKDNNGFSDPYCHIGFKDTAGGELKKGSYKKTKVIKKTLNPEWKESFEVPFDSAAVALEVSVWDEDTFGSSEFMGEVILPKSALEEPAEQWIALKARPGNKKDEVSGEILLKYRLK